MIRFIDEHQDRRSGELRWGIEPIATTLGIAPSTYHAAETRPLSARAVRDSELRPQILRVWVQNLAIHGADKVWDQLSKDGVRVARCTVERLMSDIVASVGSKGDSGDNAFAESFNGLYKWELIYPKGPWRGLDDVEFATLTYVDWFNHRRLHGEIEPGAVHHRQAQRCLPRRFQGRQGHPRPDSGWC